MQPSSFLLVFYGALFALSVAELAKTWKNVLLKPYWEYTLWSGILFLVAAFNWFGMKFRIEHIGTSFFTYIFFMIPPLLFYLLVSVFTPKEGEDFKSHFLGSRFKVFLLLALFVFSNMAISFYTGDRAMVVNVLRFISVLLALLCAFNDKIAFRIALGVYVIGGIIVVSYFGL